VKRIIATAAATAAIALVALQSTVSAAILPPAAPASRTTAAVSSWGTEWRQWAQTTIAENTGYWKPIMGTRFRQPRIFFVQQTPTHTVGCGDVSTQKTDAMYCPGDSTIYINDQFLEKQEAAYGAHAAQLILAHEFGHHIQNLQGLPFRGMLTELQADCLAGASMTSMSTAEKLDFASLAPTLLSTTDAAGDASSTDYDHGTSDERIDALVGGWNDLSSCRLTDPSGLYFPNPV
jgi:predicted metalloprotease